jgi:hypothetical protein
MRVGEGCSQAITKHCFVHDGTPTVVQVGRGAVAGTPAAGPLDRPEIPGGALKRWLETKKDKSQSRICISLVEILFFRPYLKFRVCFSRKTQTLSGRKTDALFIALFEDKP